ncbi:hypothetical protein HPP92_018582 [Vanilla planifolia]|uniref:Transmembrane protein n=2 Tax=Vanilla planifolia TaxID=51239 RepID=A0A835UMD9_VANPL|nr:hypothetical protein HPP92_018582 [Vanilla planifolia]
MVSNRNRYSSTSLLTNILLLISLLMIHVLITSPAQANHVENQHNPAPAERGIGATAVSNRWEAFLAWLKLTWMNLRPPPPPGYGKMGSGAGEKVKEASKRSFQEGKETIEAAAGAAATAAERMVVRAKEKLKNVHSSDGNPDAEL